MWSYKMAGSRGFVDRGGGLPGKTKVLFIGNLSFNTDENSLRNAFEGSISARIPKYADSRKPKRYAFVEFNTSKEAMDAYNLMYGQSLNGRYITVGFARNRDQRRSGEIGHSDGGRKRFGEKEDVQQGLLGIRQKTEWRTEMSQTLLHLRSLLNHEPVETLKKKRMSEETRTGVNPVEKFKMRNKKRRISKEMLTRNEPDNKLKKKKKRMCEDETVEKLKKKKKKMSGETLTGDESVEKLKKKKKRMSEEMIAGEESEEKQKKEKKRKFKEMLTGDEYEEKQKKKKKRMSKEIPTCNESEEKKKKKRMSKEIPTGNESEEKQKKKKKRMSKEIPTGNESEEKQKKKKKRMSKKIPTGNEPEEKQKKKKKRLSKEIPTGYEPGEKLKKKRISEQMLAGAESEKKLNKNMERMSEDILSGDLDEIKVKEEYQPVLVKREIIQLKQRLKVQSEQLAEANNRIENMQELLDTSFKRLKESKYQLMMNKPQDDEHTTSTSKTSQEVELNFKCELCKRGFRRLCDLKTHLRSHVIEKNFLCHICFKSFSTNRGLDNHIDFHNNVHSCKKCGRSFTTKYCLLKHLDKDMCPRIYGDVNASIDNP